MHGLYDKAGGCGCLLRMPVQNVSYGANGGFWDRFLDTLNVCNNMIERIEGLEALEHLTTLNITHNRLTDTDSLRGLLACPILRTVDLSHNKIDDEAVLEDVFYQMPALGVLILVF